MLYKIQPGMINKVVGWTASHHMVKEYAPEMSRSVINLKTRGKLDFVPDLNGIQILNRAKPMDIIESVPISSSGIIISDKLLKIIKKFKFPDETQIFDAKAQYKNNWYEYNYLYIFKSQEDEIVDWEKSKFIETTSAGTKTVGEVFSKNLMSMKKILVDKGSIPYDKPKKLVFYKQKLKSDIINLTYSFSGYFVTQQLKDEIEKSDCKGVDLIPIAQLGFEVEFV